MELELLFLTCTLTASLLRSVGRLHRCATRREGVGAFSDKNRSASFRFESDSFYQAAAQLYFYRVHALLVSTNWAMASLPPRVVRLSPRSMFPYLPFFRLNPAPVFPRRSAASSCATSRSRVAQYGCRTTRARQQQVSC